MHRGDVSLRSISTVQVRSDRRLVRQVQRRMPHHFTAGLPSLLGTASIGDFDVTIRSSTPACDTRRPKRLRQLVGFALFSLPPQSRRGKARRELRFGRRGRSANPPGTRPGRRIEAKKSVTVPGARVLPQVVSVHDRTRRRVPLTYTPITSVRSPSSQTSSSAVARFDQ